MKRLPEHRLFDHLVYRCPPVSFYLEDIEQIVQELDARAAKYRISDKTFEYESLAELQANSRERVDMLSFKATVKGSFQELELTFGRGGVVLRSARNDSMLILWHALRDIVARRSRWYLRPIFHPILPWLLIGLMLLTGYVVEPATVPAQFSGIFSAAKLVFPILLLVVVIAQLRRTPVFLKREYAVEGFMARNAEKLIVGTIGTGIGVAVKTVIDFLAK